MEQKKIKALSKVFLIIASVMMLMSLFVPIWQIDLEAPQYPEGLTLRIYPDKLGGDVDIINGLNHYIGMKSLHTQDFVEFKILPYIFIFFAIFSITVVIKGKRGVLNILFYSFIIFGIVSLFDFWRWEYNYGHNLDPHAAIIVPDMAYQPPLIGFKQLLNFGAYSIPDYGGWLIISSGIFILTAFLIENNIFTKFIKMKKTSVITIVVLPILLLSCISPGPEPIKINHDQCVYCKMTITENKFSCEIETNKGKILKFDDVSCMKKYPAKNPSVVVANFWVSDYLKPGTFINSKDAFFVHDEKFMSPMSGNTAAFNDLKKAETFTSDNGHSVLHWQQIP